MYLDKAAAASGALSTCSSGSPRALGAGKGAQLLGVEDHGVRVELGDEGISVVTYVNRCSFLRTAF